jgi:hypothetical protein
MTERVGHGRAPAADSGWRNGRDFFRFKAPRALFLAGFASELTEHHTPAMAGRKLQITDILVLF